MAWRLSGNLAAIRQSIWNAFSPKVTVGTIGDPSHSYRASDHNPDSRGIVCAIDVMYPVGAKASAVVRAAVGRADLAYIIHNRTIWSANNGWKAARYTGSDPHTNHVHISSKHTSTADQRRVGLNLGGIAPVAPAANIPAYPGLLKRGSKGLAVQVLQQRLNERGYAHIAVDQDFGADTEDRVRKFQRYARIRIDGIVGPVTHRALWTKPIT
jgi:murein L,D-transpeptidase YcbB/YkuD